MCVCFVMKDSRCKKIILEASGRDKSPQWSWWVLIVRFTPVKILASVWWVYFFVSNKFYSRATMEGACRSEEPVTSADGVKVR
ncbi:unnamed protein product [Lactuca virosa]|uniref:Uncharacterized protein n=1 Tax=Lactuca virosa TaxID=75947 RepID=A0AAU9PHJ9_9ASTR|nr:unnamed protein product [Lactuca virosa]